LRCCCFQEFPELSEQKQTAVKKKLRISPFKFSIISETAVSAPEMDVNLTHSKKTVQHSIPANQKNTVWNGVLKGGL
jgi:hypothetical protein